MEQLSLVIYDEYGIRINDTHDIGRDKILLDTDNGTLLLEKKVENITHYLFITGLYQYMGDDNSICVVKTYMTNSGKYYLPFEDGIYLLYDYVPQKLNFRDKGADAAKALARFHTAARGYVPPPGAKSESNWGRWAEKFKSKCRVIKKCMEETAGKAKKSDFEKMLLGTYKEYIGRMEKSQELLKSSGYIESTEESMKCKQICLCDVKQSNFCFMDGKAYIKSLYKCRYDIVEKDISDLLCETIKYSGNLRKTGEIVDAYSAENSLTGNSMGLINAFLLFPDEYEKVSMRYFDGKKDWSESEYMAKLISAIGFEDIKYELIKYLNRAN